MGTASERLLPRLQGVRGAGGGAWVASCPAPGHGKGHGDRNPSLSIRQIEGQVLLYCHAGCTVEEVATSVGLTVADLYDKEGGISYPYVDTQGRVTRTVHRSATKGFTQKIHDKTATPLYRLAEVLTGIAAGKPVYVCEGEKDADTLRSLGVCATSTPGGAGNWKQSDYTPLKGAKEIIVCQDKDAPGRKRGSALTTHLTTLLPGATVRLVEAAAGNDVADHVMSGKALSDLIDATPTVPTPSGQAEDTSVRVVRLVDLRDYEMVRPLFAKPDWYPMQTLSIVAGKGGIGKSSLVYADLAAATRGELSPDIPGPMRCLIVSHEDSQGMIRARLSAAGANFDYLHSLTVTQGGAETIANLSYDMAAIEDLISHEGIQVVLFDPIQSYIQGDTNKREKVRAVVDPLAQMAHRTGVAIIGIAHTNKGGGTLSDKVNGSAAWRDACRCLLVMAADPNTKEQSITLDKSNYTNKVGTSWAYTINTVPVTMSDGTTTDYPLVTITGETSLSAETIINRGPLSEGEDAERGEAEQFILDYLYDAGGEAPSGQVLKAGRAAGFTDGQLKTARSRSKNPHVSTRKLPGKGSPWGWSIDISLDLSQEGNEGKGAKGYMSGNKQPYPTPTPIFPQDTKENRKVTRPLSPQSLGKGATLPTTPAKGIYECAECGRGVIMKEEIKAHSKSGLCGRCHLSEQLAGTAA